MECPAVGHVRDCVLVGLHVRRGHAERENLAFPDIPSSEAALKGIPVYSMEIQVAESGESLQAHWGHFVLKIIILSVPFSFIDINPT